MKNPNEQKRRLTLKSAALFAGATLVLALLLRFTYLSCAGKYIPVLMYHHIADSEDSLKPFSVTAEKFAGDMRGLKDAGYTAISFADLLAFNGRTGSLPAKPIIITFDDGYYSNYEFAFPILKELGMVAAINVIGEFIDSERPGAFSPPYFSWEEAALMYESGVIDIQCHSYDYHSERDGFTGIVKNSPPYSDGDTEKISADILKIRALIMEKTGSDADIFAFPFGNYDFMSPDILKSAGIKAALTTDPGVNYIKKGGGSLYALKRFNIDQDLSVETLLLNINKHLIKNFFLG